MIRCRCRAPWLAISFPLYLLLFTAPAIANEQPVIGDDPFVNPTQTLFTDEATPVTVELTPGTDADGDFLQAKIQTPPSVGALFQYDDGEPGDPITEPDTPVTDIPLYRVIYVPTERSAAYTDTFVSVLTDGTDDSVNQETVRIQVAAENAPPEITSSPTPTAFVGEPYEYVVEAADPDADHLPETLAFSLTQGPPFLTIAPNGDGTATLGGTPAAAFAGNHDVTLEVTDPLGATAAQSFRLIVIPPEILQFDAAENDNQISEDTTWAFDKVLIVAGEDNSSPIVTVPAGVTLTIAPGTTVEFRDNLGLVVAGGLVAEGTAQKPVIFRGEQWGGISFSGASEPSVLDFATISGVKGTFGGAISVIGTDDLEVRNSEISQSEAVYGGGFYILGSDPIIADNEIVDNKQVSRGGGIYVENGAPEISGNLIARNTEVVQGGGLFLSNSDAVLRNNRITGNVAQQGGGLLLQQSNPVMDNLLIANNTGTVRGGGLLLEGSNPTLRHGTIAYNLSPKGPGLHLTGSSPVLTGTILYGNGKMDDEGADNGEAQQMWADSGSTPTIRFSTVEEGLEGIKGGNTAYSDNLAVDPLFQMAPKKAGAKSSGDYSLTPASPVINAASTDSGDLPATDIDGGERVFNSVRADMGAFEFPNNPPTLPEPEFSLPETEEDAERTVFSLSELAPASDPDKDPVIYVLVEGPEFGTLFQKGEDGTAQQLPDTGGVALPLGAEGALEYAPANRSDPYTDRFTIRVAESLPDEEKSREMTSVETPSVTVSVTADNDPPVIESDPNTAVPVGSTYAYELSIVDPDQDDPAETLQTTAEPAPDWLTLGATEDGAPLLTGTPTEANIGEFSITLRVTDDQGAFTEQSFGLTVAPQGILAVDAGPDRTGAPEETIFFEAAGEGGDPLTYAWTVVDADGEEIKTGTGEQFSWTPDVPGLFSAVVTVTDDRGSVPAEDRVEVAVAAGFEPVDEARREPPSAEDAAAIAGLRNLDPATLNPDAATETVAQAAKLDLSPGQRSDVLAGMSAILTADGNPPPDRISSLLGAADNLVVETDPDPAAVLTPEQTDQALNVLEAAANAPALEKTGVFKAVETLDEIVSQKGEAGLTNDQIGRVGEILETAADRAVAGGEAVTVTGFENLALDVRPLELTTPTVPESLGGTPPADAQVTLSPTLLAQVRDQFGVSSATGRFTANGVTAGRGVRVNASLLGPDGAELDLAGLPAPAEISIPVKIPDRQRPLVFDPAAGEWTDHEVSNIQRIGEDAVIFEASRLDQFALFEPASNPLTGEDRSDTEKVVDAIEDLGSGSGCFLETLSK